MQESPWNPYRERVEAAPVCIGGGMLLIGSGAFLLLLLYGFANLLDPAIRGAAREAAIGRLVLRDPAFPFGPILIAAGGCLLAAGIRWMFFLEPAESRP